MKKIQKLKNKILCWGDGFPTTKVRLGDHLGVWRNLPGYCNHMLEFAA
jgi:hypothetical protein